MLKNSKNQNLDGFSDLELYILTKPSLNFPYSGRDPPIKIRSHNIPIQKNGRKNGKFDNI